MRLAKTFVEIDSAEKEPAEAKIKSYSPIGRVSGTGHVDVSAIEIVVPAQEVAFHGIQIEVRSGQEFSGTGIATIPVSDATKLLASLEKLANTSITTDRFAFTEVEMKIEGLKIVVFNNDRGRTAFLVDANGVGSHFARQAVLLDLHKLVSLAVDHLQSKAAALM